MGHSRPLFYLFSSFQQLTVNIFIMKFCQSVDSNNEPLVYRSTALPTELQTLPKIIQFVIHTIQCTNLYPPKVRFARVKFRNRDPLLMSGLGLSD